MALSHTALDRRHRWLNEIMKLSGEFGADSGRIGEELTAEIVQFGTPALLDHLHLCGTIPEYYRHDSSEEKLYSKYTDWLLAMTLNQIGMKAVVLTERADAADVQATARTYSLVADAKAFRLSRTAKNQKDFKVEAMHTWRRDSNHAMVVCPAYQLPVRSSQIYQQAIARNVCIVSYSHLAVALRFSQVGDGELAQQLLLKVFRCTESMKPSKDAVGYWSALNQTMLNFDPRIADLWVTERSIVAASISAAKTEGLSALTQERDRTLSLTREEAIEALIRDRNLSGREQKISGVVDNRLLAIGSKGQAQDASEQS